MDDYIDYGFPDQVESTPKENKATGEDFGGFDEGGIDEIEENIKVEDVISRRTEVKETGSVVIQKAPISEIIPQNKRTVSTSSQNELIDLINQEPDGNSRLGDYSNINSQKGNKRNILSKMQVAENKYIDLKIDLDRYMKNTGSADLAKQNEELLGYLDKLNDIVSLCVNASRVPVKNPSFGVTAKKAGLNKQELSNVNNHNNNKLINVYRNEYNKLEQRFKQIADKTYEESLESKLHVLNTDIGFYEQENKKLTHLQKQSEVFIERHQKFNPNSTEMKKMHTDYESLRTLNEGLIEKIQKGKAQITENELKLSQANERLEKLQSMAREMGIEVLENVKEEAENDKRVGEKREVLKKKMDILDRVLRTNKKKYESEIIKNERFIVQLEKDKIQMMKILKEKTLNAYDNQQKVREFYQQYNNSDVYFAGKKKYSHDSDLPYIINTKPNEEIKVEHNSEKEVKTEENYIINNKPNFNKISFQPNKTNPDALRKEEVKTPVMKTEEIDKVRMDIDLESIKPNEPMSIETNQVETPKDSERFREVEDSPPQKLFSKNNKKSNSLINNNDKSILSNRLSYEANPSATGTLKSERKEVTVIETNSFDIVAKGSSKGGIGSIESNRDSEQQTLTKEENTNQVFIHKTLESKKDTQEEIVSERPSERKQLTDRNEVITSVEEIHTAVKEPEAEKDKHAEAVTIEKKPSKTNETPQVKKGGTINKNYESIESLDFRDLRSGTINDMMIVQTNTIVEVQENTKTIENDNKSSVPLFLRDYSEKDKDTSTKEEFVRRVGIPKDEEQPKKRVRGVHEEHRMIFEKEANHSDNVPKVNDEASRRKKEEFDNLFKEESYKTQQYHKADGKKVKRDLFEDLDEVIL
jgi:hypothetical protein